MPPFPTTQLIHEHWSRLHQPVVVGSMNAVCRITRPSLEQPGEFDPVTGSVSDPTPYVVADGVPCRVQRIREAMNADQAGQDTTARVYQVTVPVMAPIAEEDDLIEVTGTRDEATAENTTGLLLTITDRYRGSEEFDRVYMTEHNAG